MSYEYPTVRRIVGHFDLCHPREQQASYHFSLPPDAPKRNVSHCVDVDGQYDREGNVWASAEDMLADAKRMLFCGGLADLEAMNAYLDEHYPEHRYHMALAKLEAGEARLVELRKEVDSATKGYHGWVEERATAIQEKP